MNAYVCVVSRFFIFQTITKTRCRGKPHTNILLPASARAWQASTKADAPRGEKRPQGRGIDRSPSAAPRARLPRVFAQGGKGL